MADWFDEQGTAGAENFGGVKVDYGNGTVLYNNGYVGYPWGTVDQSGNVVGYAGSNPTISQAANTGRVGTPGYNYGNPGDTTEFKLAQIEKDPALGGQVDANGFVSGVNLQDVVNRYNQIYGGGAQFVGGPSGDRVVINGQSFDARQSGGKLWALPTSGAGAGGSSAGGGYVPGGGGAVPTSAPGGGGPSVGPGGSNAPGGYPTFQAPEFKLSDVGFKDPGAFQAPTNPNAGNQFTFQPYDQQFTYKPWDQTFQAPTGLTEQNDPGFQSRLNLGADAIQRSAAAQGTLLTGGTLRGLQDYAQNLASNEYQNVYNRAAQQYQQNYQQYLQGYQQAKEQYGQNYQQYLNAQNQALAQRQQQTQEYNTQYAQALQAHQQQVSDADAQYQRQLNQYKLAYGESSDQYQRALQGYQQWYTEQQQAIQNARQQQALDLQAQGQAFNQNFATQQQQWNELYGLANLGYNAAGQQSSAYQNQGVYGGNDITGAGNARAAGTVGSANAYGDAITNAAYGGLSAYYGFPQNTLSSRTTAPTLGFLAPGQQTTLADLSGGRYYTGGSNTFDENPYRIPGELSY